MAKGIIIRHPAKSYRRLSKAEWKSVMRLYENGCSANRLSERFGICVGSVTGGLARRGLAIRHSRKPKKFTFHDWRVIRAIYRNGMSARKIAAQFGVPHSTITRGLAYRGVAVRNRPPLRLGLSTTEKAYLAGLFDGEGHVAIALNHGGRRTGSHFVYLGITNTHLPTIRFLSRRMGGFVRCNKRSPLSLRPCWAWNLTSRQAVAFLRTVFQFLRIKKERVRLALLLAERMKRYGLGKPIRPAEFAARERIRQKLRGLNGRIHEPDPKHRRKTYDYLRQFK